jgi:hypothetical protein
MKFAQCHQSTLLDFLLFQRYSDTVIEEAWLDHFYPPLPDKGEAIINIKDVLTSCLADFLRDHARFVEVVRTSA